jgi:hypothetical protein
MKVFQQRTAAKMLANHFMNGSKVHAISKMAGQNAMLARSSCQL